MLIDSLYENIRVIVNVILFNLCNTGFGDKEYRPGSNEPSNNQNQRFDFKYTEQIMNNHNEIGNISSSRVKKRLSEAHQHQSMYHEFI